MKIPKTMIKAAVILAAIYMFIFGFVTLVIGITDGNVTYIFAGIYLLLCTVLIIKYGTKLISLNPIPKKSITKDESAFLPILGFIIGVLFILVVMVSYASYIIKPITDPIINATNGTDHQAISTSAVNRGYNGLALGSVAIPVALVLGFFVYLVLTNRSYDQ